MPTSEKRNVQYLVQLFKQHHIRHVVFSPGSRNAPLVLGFANDPYFETTVIHDERSAAFYALGVYQSTQRPVAVCCTSGSAAANYYPAVTEAFYQRIPLILLTADRPHEWIDQSDGQTIRQQGLFSNHINYQCSLIRESENEDSNWYNVRVINEALNTASSWNPGPVHINIPFDEPLYGLEEELPKVRSITPIKGRAQLDHEQEEMLLEKVANARKPLIMIGQGNPPAELEGILSNWIDRGAVVLTESTSNVQPERSIGCIDRLFIGLPKARSRGYAPDLLITFGGAIVSKKIKALLREWPIKEHFHISREGDFPDTYRHLTSAIQSNPIDVLRTILPDTAEFDRKWFQHWMHLVEMAHERHHSFVDQIPFSDFKIFAHLLEQLPAEFRLQLGNSTVVRYAQLFEEGRDSIHFCNRGTSGIDGSMSTAVGYAASSGKPTLHVTGDISFFYDSNALAIPSIPEGFKVLLINNEGGGIFRYIPGPSQTPQLEEYFEARHQHQAEGLARTYGFQYRLVETESEFLHSLPQLFDPNRGPLILEVKTPREENDKILREYFKYIHHG
mgnify:CR=1 FL=1